MWRNLKIFGYFCFLTAIALGCAMAPPTQSTQTVQQAQELKNIVGKWEGFMSSLRYGQSFVTLTIKEDGAYEMVSGSQRYVGTAYESDGKLRFKSGTTGTTGLYTLEEKDGKRRLLFQSDCGTVKGDLSPARK